MVKNVPFLDHLLWLIQEADYIPISDQELEARQDQADFADANNALEGMPTTAGDIWIHVLFDEYRVPDDVAAQLLRQAAQKHPKAYLEFSNRL